MLALQHTEHGSLRARHRTVIRNAGVLSLVKYLCKFFCSQTENFTSATEETMGFRRITGNPNGLESILTLRYRSRTFKF